LDLESDAGGRLARDADVERMAEPRVVVARRVCRVAERRGRGLAAGGGGELQRGAGGAAIDGDLPFSDDDAVGETVGIAKPTLRRAEGRMDAGNPCEAGGAGKAGVWECARASGIAPGQEEGRGAARRVARLVGGAGHRFRWGRTPARSVARRDREQRRS